MDEKTKDRIVEMFDRGLLLAPIAAKIGCAESYVTRILQERGRSAWKRRYPNQDGWDWDAIFADYQNRMPFEALLQKHRVSCTTFHRHRKAEGVPLRERLGAPGKQNYQYKDGSWALNQKLHRIYGRAAREVATALFGEPIPKGWHVHHMNENPAYNDPTNLVLFPGNSEHMKYHQRLLMLQRAGVEVDATRLVSENGGTWLLLPPPQWQFSSETGQFALLETQPSPTQDRPGSELDQAAFDLR